MATTTDPRLSGPLQVEYGSPEYDELSTGDPRRRAAVLHAAECWRLLSESPHAAELLAEWVEWDRRRDERDSSRDIAGSRRTWAHVSYAELERRRAEPGRIAQEWRERHGGEYQCGPVEWATGRPARRAA